MDGVFLSRKEAAALLGVDPVSISNYANQGLLHGTRQTFGGITVWRFAQETVLAFKKKRDAIREHPSPRAKQKKITTNLTIEIKAIREGVWSGRLIMDGKEVLENTAESEKGVKSGLLVMMVQQMM